MPTAVLVYDADCGPCARFKRTLQFLDTRDRFRFSSISEAARSGLLGFVPPGERFRSFHLVSAGSTLSGADALPEVVRLLPVGSLCAPIIDGAPGSKALLRFVYSAFARLHDAGICSKARAAEANGRLSWKFAASAGLRKPKAQSLG